MELFTRRPLHYKVGGLLLMLMLAFDAAAQHSPISCPPSSEENPVEVVGKRQHQLW